MKLPRRHRPIDPLVERARDLRRNPTVAEQRLWHRLRGRQLDGFRFRRQVPVGPFIVDFLCVEARLVVELDGGQHGEDSGEDGRRTAWLVAQGYRVVRFWNNDVLGNTVTVLEAILAALHERAAG